MSSANSNIQIGSSIDTLLDPLIEMLDEQTGPDEEHVRLPQVCSQRKGALLADAEHRKALNVFESEKPQVVVRLRKQFSHRAPGLFRKGRHLYALLLSYQRQGREYVTLRELAKEIYYKGLEGEVTEFMEYKYMEASAIILKDMAKLVGGFRLEEAGGELLVYPEFQSLDFPP